MPDDDPKADEAIGLVLSAMTLVFTGNVKAGERELEKAKVGVPEETCDLLFGMVTNLIVQISNLYEVTPLRVVQEMGLNLARLTSGLENPES